MTHESGAFIACLFCLCLGVCIGWCVAGFIADINATSAVRQQAIEAGVARWVVDEKTGITTFEWSK